MTVDGLNMPLLFLCDLPDEILGIGAKQTVDGGKRVVGGVVYVHPRPFARELPARIGIEASSPGCKEGELSCVFETATQATNKIEMLREQRINTSGWVHGMDDICRAVPDDTIAVCSTPTRMAYVELGCDGELQLGIHDTSLPRTFDLDVEAPMFRLRGALDPASPDAATWTFRFHGDPNSSASSKWKPPASATLVMNVTPTGIQIDKGPGLNAKLTIDGATEPCIAWAIYRR